ncbi:MAG: hypothetical protein QXQ30_02785 [Candidatus Pacearchaeota archaeon]
MVEVSEERLSEIEDKIRDLINDIEILNIDEKIDDETAKELIEKLKEIANDIGNL